MAERHIRFTFPRRVRIRRRRDFQRVFDRKLRASDRWITLYGCRGDAAHARLGIVVGRSVGNAVRRNRRKRLVREAFRHLGHELPAGTDWIIVLRAGPEPAVEQLQDSIRGLARRLLERMNHGALETRRE